VVADDHGGHAHGLASQPSVAGSMIAAHRLPENAFRQGRQSQGANGRSSVRAFAVLCAAIQRLSTIRRPGFVQSTHHHAMVSPGGLGIQPLPVFASTRTFNICHLPHQIYEPACFRVWTPPQYNLHVPQIEEQVLKPPPVTSYVVPPASAFQPARHSQGVQGRASVRCSSLHGVHRNQLFSTPSNSLCHTNISVVLSERLEASGCWASTSKTSTHGISILSSCCSAVRDRHA